MNSSLVINANRKLSTKRRGKYKMCMYKDVKVQFGPGIAKQLRDSKREQEQKKDPNDPTIYWSEHPDFRGQNKEDPDEFVILVGVEDLNHIVHVRTIAIIYAKCTSCERSMNSYESGIP